MCYGVLPLDRQLCACWLTVARQLVHSTHAAGLTLNVIHSNALKHFELPCVT